jgi:hypothetical protein
MTTSSSKHDMAAAAQVPQHKCTAKMQPLPHACPTDQFDSHTRLIYAENRFLNFAAVPLTSTLAV